ncbi:MAG: pyridoxal 5'-phosphate synthase glutaminase subunit PdxT [Candidatus Marinimicrobia bacterium]|nr:pyridoxal 5'-phosphate synthase glutaminase subunit PdxT [Candidatus Neomarinimicrobiota bacterium]MDP6594143.1 pyridoxal 5'-phosphate synthase glutaminase subunit PdxT [Candidatus Neomarinimicrobiota bacterium]MDP6835621.1 pyridoxal 5'-phosphate synthase glutaminase subunit PdxT [Candidatus Neomarinimicrobiota bacterium]MDP6966334.1 pyridoxal 5'-phosphate synthase glutaminase subunit PdxT [Candidatus Neomarinimicrobiota bacterium]
MITIGILGLQGAFARHEAVLSRLNVYTRIVRLPADLDGCDGVIIPGGESTTITKLMDYIGIREPLLDFAERYPLLGTCAGMIIMASQVEDLQVRPLNLIDIEVVRNAYGRQVDSFIRSLEISTNGSISRMAGVFIRAPRIKSVGKDVSVLASIDGEPVFVRQGHHLASSFHPELSDNTTVHEYFVSLAEETVLAE